VDESTRYREIAADLQRKIESGALPPEEKLPPDAQLCEEYDASRNTVREAVRLLVTRGLAERQASRGTFVLPKRDPFSTIVTSDTGFGGFEGTVAIGKGGMTVTTPKVEIQQAPAEIAAELGLTVGSPVVIRHQQRLIKGELWSMQTSYYPMKFVTDGATRLLEVKDIAGGVRKYLDDALGIKEIGSHDLMKVRVPNPGEASAFGIPDDGWISVFETRQTGVDSSGRPVRLTISIYPADRNEFSMKTGALTQEDGSVHQVEGGGDDAVGV
jgi:GntR family transcriptional regulator